MNFSEDTFRRRLLKLMTTLFRRVALVDGVSLILYLSLFVLFLVPSRTLVPSYHSLLVPLLSPHSVLSVPLPSAHFLPPLYLLTDGRRG